MISIVDATQPQYYSHGCGCETSKCAAALDRLTGPPSACPEGSDGGIKPSFTASQFEIDTNPAFAAFYRNEYAPALQGKRVNRWIYQWLTKEPATVSTILYPAEFRAITQPGCLSSNRLYYSCTQNAYFTTAEHMPPQDRKWQGVGCVSVPDECHDLRWLKQ